MSEIILIRHGQAASNWQTDNDPGLSELGHKQAAAASEMLHKQISLKQPAPKLVSSPKKRAQETAEPLALMLKQPVEIKPAFTEVPSTGIEMSHRGEWLKGVFKENWSQQNQEILDWRKRILDEVMGMQQDTLIFCHFVVINSLVASALNDDKVFQCRPDYCSRWHFNTANGQLSLGQRGQEDDSLVL